MLVTSLILEKMSLKPGFPKVMQQKSGRSWIRTHTSADPGQCSFSCFLVESEEHQICHQACLDLDIRLAMYCVNLGKLLNELPPNRYFKKWGQELTGSL